MSGTAVVIVALGSRGDVQPCSVLAGWVAARRTDARVVLVTHAAHKPWLKGDNMAQSCHGTVWVEVPILRRRPKRERDQGGPEDAAERATADADARDACLTAAGTLRALDDLGGARSVVACNLFGLPAMVAAAAVGVGCVALSPYLMPSDRRPPASSVRRVWASVRRSSLAGRLRLTWPVFEHWAFALFSPAHAALWRRLVGDDIAAEITTFGSPGAGADAPAAAGASRPLRPPPLLYGAPPTLIEAPAFWPPDVSTTCLWHRPPPAPPSPSAAAASGRRPRRVIVTLGSLPGLGLVPPDQLAALARAAAASLPDPPSWRVDVMVGSCAASAAAIEALGMPRVRALPGDVDLPLEAARSAFAIHHGGSGTVAACLLAGTPQLVCPVMFDQPFWARRVVSLGVGKAASLAAAALPVREALGLARGAALLAPRLAPSDADREAVVARITDACRDGSGPAVGVVRAAANRAVRGAGAPFPALPVPVDAGPGGGEPPCLDLRLGTAWFRLCGVAGAAGDFASQADEVLGLDAYDEHGLVTAAAADCAASGAAVVDVGACVGLFAARFACALAQHAGPDGGACLRRTTLLAVEPNPAAADALERNLAALGMEEAVVVRSAVGTPQTGVGAELCLPEGAPSNARLGCPAAGCATVPVAVAALGALVARHVAGRRVALLKVDVEGSEAAALRGLDAAAWALVDRVVVEADGGTVEAVRRELARGGAWEWVREAAAVGGNTLLHARRSAAAAAGGERKVAHPSPGRA